ncbi:hypothetical protein [Paenibacillus donghaensis]|uniref:Uncharacterized protein n=1 Tax=Paenibacillus donghaensis TaxID=414771 RepID=A0A2Z2KGU8_9BACL|nr:hypothetical protein [Paenibacillus donghaensis]ASA22453.1 hypothetical protein B9T62_17650 [Paenibacillus donghaensis]
MDKKLMKLLKKLYLHANSVYDAERAVSTYRTDTLSPQETELLQQHGWELNAMEHLTHDGVNRKLVDLQADERLSWPVIAGAFIAGVGGSFPRGISALMSYHMMIHMQEHPYDQAKHFICCRYCAHHRDGWEHLSYIQYALHQGHIYGSSSVGAYADLSEFAKLAGEQRILPTAEDIQQFKSLLRLLEEAAEDESPGQFEKRLTTEKLLKSGAGIRRGILQSLAMVGVLPNRVLALDPGHWTYMEDILEGEPQLNNTKGRSDMQMPWAGWIGSLGVDRDKAQQLFGEYLN